ncbi:MAG TPA: Lrp/AsnC ligand binding domain-containing protein [Actinomycetota bacterium]
MEAYVLIQTDPARESIADSLLDIPGVVSAEDLTGPFDAIALARSDSTRSFHEHVVAEIQKLPGVIRALPAPLIVSLGHPRTPLHEERSVAA